MSNKKKLKTLKKHSKIVNLGEGFH